MALLVTLGRTAPSSSPSNPRARLASSSFARTLPAASLLRHGAMTDPKRAKLGGAFASRGAGTTLTSASAFNNGNAPTTSAPASLSPRPQVLSHEIVDTFNVPGIVFTDHVFRVPLDYSVGPSGGTIELFARVATSPSRAAAAAAAASAAAPATPSAPHPPSPLPDDGGPWLLYLQGGPGFEAPRPTEASSWLKSALHHGFRVVLLDQRGTGRSSPPVSPLARGVEDASGPKPCAVSASLAAACGSEDPREQARYLSFFRADSIVDDAEAVRAALVPSSPPAATPLPAAAAAAKQCRVVSGGRWSVLGQSFGGFASVTYLSRAPWGLSEVLLAGGLPPDAAGWEEEEREEEEAEAAVIGRNGGGATSNGSKSSIPTPLSLSSRSTADRVYDALFDRVVTQNLKFYKRYPRDATKVRQLVLTLASMPGGGAALPSGGVLTPRGLQLLGLAGLGSGGGFDRLHYLLERAFDSNSSSSTTAASTSETTATQQPPRITSAFLKGYESWMSWDSNPLYALLHESIYVDGPGARSAWAAERARQRGTVTLPCRSDAAGPAATTISLPRSEAFDAVASARAGRDVLFTGEMVFPWMFSEVEALRPLSAVADILAHKDDWPRLYSSSSLRGCRVPVAAAVYWEDMYVDFELSQKTAERIPTIRQWVTSEFMHSGIRDDGHRILEHLLGLARGTTPLF